MSESPGIEEALQLALDCHRGQTDAKSGSPQILHPLRVMMRVRRTEAMIVAILHDAVEDSRLTLDDLHEAGFTEPVVDAVDRLTRRDDETYDEMVERIRGSDLAVEVKLADLEDNMDLRRYTKVSKKQHKKLLKFRRHWHDLRGDHHQPRLGP